MSDGAFLERARQLEANATPGPWKDVSAYTDMPTASLHVEGASLIAGDLMLEDDAALVAYVRNRLPELLAVVEAARRRRAQCRAAPASCAGFCEAEDRALDALDKKAGELKP